MRKTVLVQNGKTFSMVAQMLIWRGWGISVFYLMVFWVLVGIGVAIAFMGYDPDRHHVAMKMQWGLVGLIAAWALSTWLISLYRAASAQRRLAREGAEPPPIQAIDHLYYIPLAYWPWIIVFLGLALAGVTAAGIALW